MYDYKNLKIFKKSQINGLTKHYLITALWSSTEHDDAGTPLHENYDIGDLSIEALDKAENDCEKFLSLAGDTLDDLDLERAAHDFWLTRNRHGAGFWDGDYEKELGRKLTALAHSFGEIDLYVGDDSRLYFFGGRNV